MFFVFGIFVNRESFDHHSGGFHLRKNQVLQVVAGSGSLAVHANSLLGEPLIQKKENQA